MFTNDSLAGVATTTYTPPHYIRLPKSGTPCPHTGLSRSALDLLTRPQAKNNYRPPVKSRVLKQWGEKRGVRMIDFQSLLNYLNRLPATA
jgi:hypothetical protein